MILTAIVRGVGANDIGLFFSRSSPYYVNKEKQISYNKIFLFFSLGGIKFRFVDEKGNVGSGSPFLAEIISKQPLNDQEEGQFKNM